MDRTDVLADAGRGWKICEGGPSAREMLNPPSREGTGNEKFTALTVGENFFIQHMKCPIEIEIVIGIEF